MTYDLRTPFGDQEALTEPDPRPLASPTRSAPLPALRRTVSGRLCAFWLASRTHVLALGDQAVVSAASFLTTIVVARLTFPTELGLYALGISVLVTASAIQESVVSLPYTIRQHQPTGTPAEHAGSTLMLCGLFSVIGSAVTAGVALVLSLCDGDPRLIAMIWALVVVSPFVLLREFSRRFAFAHFRMGDALVVDLIVAGIQLFLLVWLGWTGRMSSATACAALGTACALTAFLWLCLARRSFALRTDRILGAIRESWGLGKWLLAGQITVSMQSYATYWLLALLVGTSATGVYAACMSVALLANPLIMGVGNMLAPKSALALKEGGAHRLRREVIKDTLLLGAAMALFCVLVACAGNYIMHLLYPAREYAGEGPTLTILALAMFAVAVGMPASTALASMEQPAAIARVSLCSALLTVLLVWCLVSWWGAAGAPYGLLAGNATGAIGRWMAFLALLSRIGSRAHAPTAPEASVEDALLVLRSFASSARGLSIEPLDEGGEAHIFCVRSPAQGYAGTTAADLVIKLYKPMEGRDHELALRQFELLACLHEALDGIEIDGWMIRVPKPLHLSASPLALIMSAVPGKKLACCLEDDDDRSAELSRSAPLVIMRALRRYWAQRPCRLYGELCFDNILCEPEKRIISFIDPGVPSPHFFCDVAGAWYPASHDLAYLLYDTAVTVKGTIGNAGARRRRQAFAHRLMLAFLDTLDPLEDGLSLLDEIGRCAHEHLRSLAPAASPRGLWHLFLKSVARRRIESFLATLRADLRRQPAMPIGFLLRPCPKPRYPMGEDDG